MKTQSVLFLFLIGFHLSCTESSSHAKAQVKLENMNPEQFKSAMEAMDEPYVLLDVRTPEEWSEGILEGAKLLNYYDDNFGNLVKMLPKESTVFVYCRSGGRSGKSISYLEKAGFQRVVNLEGGVLAWQEKGFSLQKMKQ